jgi:hypothetical protein
VLLRGRGDDGGSDNTAIIIGVAVAVPLAIAAVVVLVVGILLWVRWRHQRFLAKHSEGSLTSVNFHGDDL